MLLLPCSMVLLLLLLALWRAAAASLPRCCYC
jgi:hypothetical protein